MLESIFKIRGTYALSIVGSEMRTLCAAAVTKKSLVISPHAVRTMSAANYEVVRAKMEQNLTGQKAEEEDSNSTWSTKTVLNMVNTVTERIQLAMR